MNKQYKIKKDNGKMFLNLYGHWEGVNNPDALPSMCFATETEAQEYMAHEQNVLSEAAYLIEEVDTEPLVYNKQKVYFFSNHCDGYDVFFSPGDAADAGYYWEPEHEGYVYSSGNIQDMPVTVFAIQGDWKCSGWYESKEEAYLSPEGNRLHKNGGNFVTGYLNVQHCYPIEPPLKGVLDVCQCSGVCLRIKPHPEINGTNTRHRGIFFPDGSCNTTFVPGPVTVTALTEKGRCGFFKGTQPTFTAPSDEALARYLEDGKYDGFQVQLHKHEVFGHFIAIGRHLDTEHSYYYNSEFLVAGMDGEVVEVPSLRLANLSKETLVWQKDTSDFVLST